MKWILEHILRSILNTSSHWFMILLNNKQLDFVEKIINWKKSCFSVPLWLGVQTLNFISFIVDQPVHHSNITGTYGTISRSDDYWIFNIVHQMKDSRKFRTLKKTYGIEDQIRLKKNVMMCSYENGVLKMPHIESCSVFRTANRHQQKNDPQNTIQITKIEQHKPCKN